MKRFSDLTEQEVLALAITNEEEDSRIYRGFAEGLREQFPSSAKVFDEMADEEVHHRTMLFDLYRQKFGEYLPLIRRQDVKGFIQPQAAAVADAPARARGGAQIRREHGVRGRALLPQGGGKRARRLGARIADQARGSRSRPRNARAQAQPRRILTKGAREKEDETARRMFLLQYVQPGLVGLMDGSVSTLAPLFAAAFATHNTWETFLVGMAASVGAGISMGFRRSAVRRRLAHRPRHAVAARHGLRRDDHDRRARPHAALSHSGFLDRDGRLDHRGGGRAGGDLLDPLPLHGHAVPAGGVPGRGRRRAGVHRRHLDREFVIVTRHAPA